MNEKYTVNDLAEKTGLTPYTIRYYAKEGFFPGVERNENNVRLFGTQELHLVYLIEHLKRTGLSIKEMRQFIDWLGKGDETIEARMNFFREKRAQLEAKMEELDRTLDFVKYKEWEYTKAFEAGTTQNIEALCEDMMDEGLKRIYNTIRREREF